jgi:hypothetical protein
MKAILEAPGSKRLKIQYDELLTTFAFNFNWRRCSQVAPERPPGRYVKGQRLSGLILQNPKSKSGTFGKGWHLSIGRLIISASCGIGGAIRGCLGGAQWVLGGIRVYFVSETAQVELCVG